MHLSGIELLKGEWTNFAPRSASGAIDCRSVSW
jgi:hypothetical protein